ncbi:hypothetical protein [Desulfovibrio inopinatus]|uniref:hypothetical protein n=1 Tax=Desulfovibrio inopinatus TaxID=102109 RepID=UPI000422ED8C|nr:hypothetical protein [Desulfovibrio inopinatus]
MTSRDGSFDAMKQELHFKYDTLSKKTASDTDFLPPIDVEGEDADRQGQIVRQLTGVLDTMTGLLDDQNRLSLDIDELRNEVGVLKRQKRELEFAYKQKIHHFEVTLRELQNDRDALTRMFMDYVNSQSGSPTTPPDYIMCLPLVIRSEKNEFLGVADKNKHFNLKEFMRGIERNRDGKKTFSLQWERRDIRWILRLNTVENHIGRRHCHILEIRPTLTPKKNMVARLVNLTIDGNAVPESLLLLLFKKIKDTFMS